MTHCQAGDLPCGKFLASSVSDEHNVKAALVLLLVHNCSDTPSVVPSSSHAKLPDVKLDKVFDLACLQV